MKISEIISEDLTAKEQYRQMLHRNPELARRALPWIQMGYSWDTAAEFARDDMYNQHGGWGHGKYDVNRSRHMDKNVHGRPELPGHRNRTDALGRNLQHDRYYRGTGDVIRRGAGALSGSDVRQNLDQLGDISATVAGGAARVASARGKKALKTLGRGIKKGYNALKDA